MQRDDQTSSEPLNANSSHRPPIVSTTAANTTPPVAATRLVHDSLVSVGTSRESYVIRAVPAGPGELGDPFSASCRTEHAVHEPGLTLSVRPTTDRATVVTPVVHGAEALATTTTETSTPETSTPSSPAAGSTTISATGGTIHHHGLTPCKRTASTSPSNSSSATLAVSDTTITGTAFTPTAEMALVRTAGSPRANSPGAPPKKKIKLELDDEGKLTYRQQILTVRYKDISMVKEQYIEYLTELFFLRNGGNLMDYMTWKKRATPQLMAFLQTSALENLPDDLDEEDPETLVNDELQYTAVGNTAPIGTPVAISTSLPPNVSSAIQHGTDPRKPGGRHGMLFGPHQPTEPLQTPVPPGFAALSPGGVPVVSSPIGPPGTTFADLSMNLDGSLVSIAGQTPHKKGSSPRMASQDAIVERAKHEAQVMSRIADLRKDGLWSIRRLPKVQEPGRNKAHWDYLLEEMQWLAADFAQERKWKKAGCRKIARMVLRYHQEKEQSQVRAEKEESEKPVKIARTLAKMIDEFWTNIEKVVQYKQQTRLDEKRKKAMDLQLSFIVDQTEKYSTWLTEGLVHSAPASKASSVVAIDEDGEFRPPRDFSSDDEETIEKEEEDLNDDDTRAEIDALQKDGELPLEELIRSLPAEVLEKPAGIEDAQSETENTPDEEEDMEEEDDDEEDSVGEEETTLSEQEEHEMKEDNVREEMEDLKAEGELSMEELMAKYAGAYDSDFEMPETPDETEDDGDDEDEEVSEDADSELDSVAEEFAEEQDWMDELGMEALLESKQDEAKSETVESESSQSLTGDDRDVALSNIAAQAQSLQPTGYTLQTTKVITNVPFLLKHTLREYQHVGLDWLATMYDRKLNGILADEMGLGKTIQTIALIAHLACERGVWGPHLIVVPTSVMLNWELEFKKWAPGLKILTYYGTQKERKAKRTGWTKTNAFHVCITSYKLVIQDHVAFRRKKWKYLVLDEAQNIKNFKSQRWQTLLNFSSQRRLLLTGTPLQNNLMELWSLMHFLMPHVFASHKDFKEWFSNPLTGMIEGSQEYNDNLIRRLHKVLRPFLLRRLKVDVEKQMPKKYEHVVMCRLSKRQRFLYDDFMSQTKTRETLSSGHFMSVINVLMQLRKVCNHPNLFDARPIVSPFQCEQIVYQTASLILEALRYDPLNDVDFFSLYPNIPELNTRLPKFVGIRAQSLQTPVQYVVEIDDQPEPPARPRPVPLKSIMPAPVRVTPAVQPDGRGSPVVKSVRPRPVLPHPLQRHLAPMTIQPQLNLSVAQRLLAPAARLLAPLTVPFASQQLIVPAAVQTTQPEQLPGFVGTKLSVHQNQMGTPIVSTCSTPITVQIQQTQQGPRFLIPPGQIAQLPSFIQIVQTSAGQHVLAPAGPPPVVQPVAPLVQQSQAGLVPPNAASPRPLLPAHIVNGLAPVTGPAVTVTYTATTSLTTHPTATPSTTGVLAPPPTNGGPLVRSSAPVQLPVTSSNNHKPVMRVTPLQPDSDLSHAPAISVGAPGQSWTSIGHSDHAYMSLKFHEQTGTNGLAVSGTPGNNGSMRSSTVAPASSITTAAITSVATSATQSRVSKRPRPSPAEDSPFYLPELAAKRQRRRREKLELVARINENRCAQTSTFGPDVRAVLDALNEEPGPGWHNGTLHCTLAQSRKCLLGGESYWSQSKALTNMVRTPELYCLDLRDITDRYAFVTPPVMAHRIHLRTSRPTPDHCQRLVYEERLHRELSPRVEFLHPISSRMCVQFPEPRLIQYDCGKLQTLDILLRQLKSGDHRVLIFTQMTRMLDILEAFLNYHGHRYLRLDGTTKVEQRQVLMDRYNVDRRIFAMILSTRSGGVGVNLTGADTVVFYDSDWNPTMDAQAQDRCHRIGQTRDVHIYRLISKMTIEENILKKANQKRLLGDVAIEGGNFTTAFFRKNTLNELFEEPSGLEALAKEKECAAAAEKSERQRRSAVVKAEVRIPEPASTPAPVGKEMTDADLEQALCDAEEEADVQAAKLAKAEQSAELAEFDENIPWDEREAERRREEQEMSKVELELANLDKELSPIERYAVVFMETLSGPLTCEELDRAEEAAAQSKEEWELTRLKQMKEEEEIRAEVEEDEMLFTYSREDAYNQAFIMDNGETMPMWAPPTPPVEDSDLYVEAATAFLYDCVPMAEEQLPPIYFKKENKRTKLDPAIDPNALLHAARKQKARKEEQGPRVPRSLFDRPTAALVKMRREAKMQKVKGLMRPPLKSLPVMAKQTPVEPVAIDQPDWLIHEDWALLQAVQTLLELPLNLTVVSPAQIPNWDLVADVVNAASLLYRSPKICKNRFESVIVPREEGRVVYDVNPKKQKKKQSIYKIQTKHNRPVRTSQLFSQDNHGSVTQLHSKRFDAILGLAAKREPTLRPRLSSGTPTQKNAKHQAILQEAGISYDQPLTPVRVATIRAERIEKEKKKQAEQAQERERQLAAQRALAAQRTATTTATVAQIGSLTTLTTVTHLPTAVTATAASSATVASVAKAAGLTAGITAINLPRGPGQTSSIVVNAPGAVASDAFAAINKRISQGLPATATAVSAATLAGQQRVRAAGNVTTMTVQEITNQGQARAFQTSQGTPTVITTANSGKLGAKRFTSAATVQQLTQAKLSSAQYNLIRNVQGANWPQQPIRATHKLTVTAAQRLAVGQQKTIKRPMTDQDMQLLLKHQALKQQQAAAQSAGSSVTAIATSQPGATIQQIQVSQGQLPPTQIITQQVAATSGVAPVATLVKTVTAVSGASSAPAGTTTMTLPANTVNINVSLPQHKGKIGTPAGPQQQIRHLHFQNLHRKPLPQQKIATLTPAQVQHVTGGKVSQIPASLQIIQQQQPSQKSIPATVTMQQFHHLIKQPTIQQIITSMTPNPASTGTTVIVTQAPPTVQNIAKLSVPASSIRNVAHVSLATPTSSNSGAQIKLAEQIFGSKSSVTPSTSAPVITITAAPGMVASSPGTAVQSAPTVQAHVTISKPSSQQSSVEPATVIVHQSPCPSPSQGESVLAPGQKPYTMRLRNPPK